MPTSEVRPSWVLHSLPHELWVFLSGWLEQTLFQAVCECQALSPLILSAGSFPALGCFLRGMCWAIECLGGGGADLKISGFCFCTALSSLVLYSESSSHFGLSGLSVSQVPLGTIFCAMVWKPSQGSKLGNLFPYSQGLLCFVAWYPVSWELLFHIFSPVYFGRFR